MQLHCRNIGAVRITHRPDLGTATAKHEYLNHSVAVRDVASNFITPTNAGNERLIRAWIRSTACSESMPAIPDFSWPFRGPART